MDYSKVTLSVKDKEGKVEKEKPKKPDYSILPYRLIIRIIGKFNMLALNQKSDYKMIEFFGRFKKDKFGTTFQLFRAFQIFNIDQLDDLPKGNLEHLFIFSLFWKLSIPASKLTRLKKLKSLTNVEMDDESMKVLPKTLRSFDFSIATLKIDHISAINGLSKLRKLGIDCTTNKAFKVIEKKTNEKCFEAIRNLASLKTVCLNTNNSLFKILDFPKLVVRKLILSNIKFVKTKSLKDLISDCKSLTKLWFINCQLEDEKSIPLLLEKYKSLKELLSYSTQNDKDIASDCEDIAFNEKKVYINK